MYSSVMAKKKKTMRVRRLRPIYLNVALSVEEHSYLRREAFETNRAMSDIMREAYFDPDSREKKETVHGLDEEGQE